MSELAENILEVIEVAQSYVTEEENKYYFSEKPLFGLDAAIEFLEDSMLHVEEYEEYLHNMNYAKLWLYDHYFDKYNKKEYSKEIAELIGLCEKGIDVSAHISELELDVRTHEFKEKDLKLAWIINKYDLQPVAVHDNILFVSQYDTAKRFVNSIEQTLIEQLNEYHIITSFEPKLMFAFMKERSEVVEDSLENFLWKVNAANTEPIMPVITDQYLAAGKAFAYSTCLTNIGISCYVQKRAKDMFTLLRSRQMGFLKITPELAWQLQITPQMENWLDQEQEIIHDTLGKILFDHGIPTHTKQFDKGNLIKKQAYSLHTH